MTAFSLRLTHGANAVSASSTRHTANATWQGVAAPRDPGHHQRRPRADLAGPPDARRCSSATRRRPRRPRREPAAARFWERLGGSADARAVGRPPAPEAGACDLRPGPPAQPVRAPRRGAGELAELEDVARPDVLTIGFARRFATYKRAALLFTDIDRLARLLWDAERPVQIVFAGKAHPADRPGQRVIQDIFGRSREPQAPGPGVHPRGLRHPHRPLPRPGRRRLAQHPAAAARGVGHDRHEGGRERRRQRRVLDGWWDEGWTGDNGWAIGGRETNPDEGAQDWADAQDLYRLLEQEIVPRYYDRDATDLPPRWLAADARLDGQHDLALLDHADAPGVRGAALPAGRRHRRPAPSRVPAGSHALPARAVAGPTEDRTVAPRISLALALHNHQPVGNFGWVFADVYETAYLPMVEALERHPGVRCSLHYTGPAARLARGGAAGLHRAAARPRRARPGGDAGRRLLRAGPRVAPGARPRRPARADGRERRAHFGRRPRGAWLAERVWEPDLPTSLARPATAGRSSTTHTSGRPRSPRRASGAPYSTDDQGSRLTSSAPSRACATASRSARSRTSSTTCATTRPRRATGSAMMGDDGEKFGAWPTTCEHCWGQGRWVDRFFEALEANADWLTTITPSDWLAAQPPLGRVYVPTARTRRWASGPCRPASRVVFTRLLQDAEAQRPAARPAGCAAASGATSRSSTARSTTSTSRCCGRRRRSHAMAARAPRVRRWTTCTAASRTTATGTGCSAASTLPHAPGDVEHLIAAEDARRPRRSARCATRRAVDLDLDGIDEVAARRARPGRRGQAGRGCRHRRVGHPRGPARACGRAAAPAGGLPRDAARPRGRGRLAAGPAGARRAGTAAASRRRSTTSS